MKWMLNDVDRAYDIGGFLLVVGALIVFGATALVWFTGRERDQQSAIKISNAKRQAAIANEKAAQLELDLERERAKLAPRAITKQQWDALQALKGEVSEVNITYEWGNLEAGQFFGQIQAALKNAGVKAIQTPAEPYFHWSGNMFAIHKKSDTPEHDDPIVAAFTKAGLGGQAGEAIFALFPMSHTLQHIGVPIIAIGERRLEYITKPYFSPAEQSSSE